MEITIIKLSCLKLSDMAHLEKLYTCHQTEAQASSNEETFEKEMNISEEDM